MRGVNEGRIHAHISNDTVLTSRPTMPVLTCMEANFCRVVSGYAALLSKQLEIGSVPARLTALILDFASKPPETDIT